jgi:hypothetical protein
MTAKIKKQQGIGGKRIKSPDVPVPSSTDHLSPVFCLRYLDKDFGLTNCEKDEKVSLIEKLHTLSQLTWAEIKCQHRHKNGVENIPRHQIRGRIPNFITEDVENFTVFRFDGLKPMVGHRRGNVFHIIWLDRDFTLYDHN